MLLNSAKCLFFFFLPNFAVYKKMFLSCPFLKERYHMNKSEKKKKTKIGIKQQN